MRYHDLCESVDFMPGTKNGDTINWPENGTKNIQVPCDLCDDEGQIEYNDGPHPCPYCHGKKSYEDTEYLFPSMNIANDNIPIICHMLGVDNDSYGWIEHKDLANIKQRLIKLVNGDVSAYTREPSVTAGMKVDNSGPITRIGKTATFHDLGVSQHQVAGYAQRLMKLVDWAQKNNCGLYWA